MSELQARMICNAALEKEPQSATSLNHGLSIAGRDHLLTPLVTAGFLIRVRTGRHPKYRITPAGLELAAYLRRLDAAREHK